MPLNHKRALGNGFGGNPNKGIRLPRSVWENCRLDPLAAYGTALGALSFGAFGGGFVHSGAPQGRWTR